MKFIIPVAAVLLAVILSACDMQTDQTESSQLEQSNQATFIDEQSCMGCHKQEFNDWKGSHHDLAMDIASDETVLGDFNRAEFSLHGVTSNFFKRDNKFFVHTDDKDGKLQDFEISYVFGVDPLQQYLIKFTDGRMQALDIAWDTRPEEQGGQRWFHLHPDEKINAKHPFHWTKRFLNWNFMCAECHSTHLKKNFDLKSNTFKTTWSKIDVGCQACHGPGSDHVAWANARNKSARKESKGLAVDLAAKNSRIQVESCARCHARRSNVSDKYEHGKPLMDFYQPQILREPFYHSDGQVKDEVYVYGSFVQSKMYARGVKCTDCHNAHTSRLRFKGNNLCISCHNSAPEKRFEGLKQKAYDTAKHHFHKIGSKGAQCASCHMPEKTYMGVDARKDHSFRIPRPDLSLKIKTPNACTQCHQDRSNQWAANAVAKWYPTSAERYKQTVHFSEVFSAAQSSNQQTPATATGLIQIATDQSQPAITRATAIDLLAAYPSLQTIDVLQSVLQSVLQHENPLIRYHAVHSLDALIPKAAGEPMLRKKLNMLVLLLGDPVRAVRTEAARALSDVPEAMFAKSQYVQFRKSLVEYFERQQSIADRPEAHLNMGLIHQRMGKAGDAEAAYKTAIRLVPDDLPSRFNLANLYHVQGKNSKAEGMFREIITIDKNSGEAHYSLGLLLAELGRLNDAEPVLQRASTLMPNRIRVRYNYALVLKKLGKDQEALNHMQKVMDANSTDPMMVYVLTTWLAEAKRYNEALPWAKKLVQLVPNEDGAKHLLIDIRNRKLRNQQ